MQTYVVTPHSNRLTETVLMRGHNIGFYAEIWEIIPKLFLLPSLIWSTVQYNPRYRDSNARTNTVDPFQTAVGPTLFAVW